MDEMDIVQLAFNDIQQNYNHFDASSVQRVPVMVSYNRGNLLRPHSLSSSMSPSSQIDDSSSNMFPMTEENFFTLTNSTPMEMPAPRVIILDQPVDKFRFRYKSEMMGTHGCLASVSSTSKRKRQAPTAKLVDFVGLSAKIRCTLVTSDVDRRIPHAHQLVKREGNIEIDTPYEIDVSVENDYTAQFPGMGIIHTAKKYIKDELVRKLRTAAIEKHRARDPNTRSLRVSEETQIKIEADHAQKWMNLNSVSLCFQAFVEDANGVMTPITEPTYSVAINNLKSALTGELKICRIDKYSSSCDGGEEVFMLVEKVGKKNIKVKFFEVDENDHEIWSSYGRFSELDVHHQYAIVFRTPPYDREITAPKEVYIKLERPTDGDCSEPIKFTYKPRDCPFGKKRPRMSYSDSMDFNKFKITDNNVNANHFPIPANESLTNSSQELLKLLHANNRIPSDEFAKFINSIDISLYANTIGPSDDDLKLTTDGGASEDDEEKFALNLLHTTMQKIQKESHKAKEYFIKMFDERTTYGDTVLHSAVRHNQLDITKYLLMMAASDDDFKFMLHLKNSSGKTPLHYAVLLNRPQVVRALLVLGANPNECDDRDLYPLCYAVQSPDAGECVDALLSNGAYLEVRNEAGWTPLHLAAEAGSLYAVKALIEAGANVHSCEISYGRTALHIAVENGQTEIVEYLLEKTPMDVNKTNLGGNTALHTAVVSSGMRAKELCEILLAHGADPHRSNGIEESIEKGSDRILTQNDEEIAGNMHTGQTSFDLALDRPELLRLLGTAFEDRRTSSVAPPIKEEQTDDTNTMSMHLDSQSIATLAKIIDKNNNWTKLAAELECHYLLNTLDITDSSPSLAILNFALVQDDLAMAKLWDIFVKIGETEAANFVERMKSGTMLQTDL